VRNDEILQRQKQCVASSSDNAPHSLTGGIGTPRLATMLCLGPAVLVLISSSLLIVKKNASPVVCFQNTCRLAVNFDYAESRETVPHMQIQKSHHAFDTTKG
jgi:hypothetical protein